MNARAHASLSIIALIASFFLTSALFAFPAQAQVGVQQVSTGQTTFGSAPFTITPGTNSTLANGSPVTFTLAWRDGTATFGNGGTLSLVKYRLDGAAEVNIGGGKSVTASLGTLSPGSHSIIFNILVSFGSSFANFPSVPVNFTVLAPAPPPSSATVPSNSVSSGPSAPIISVFSITPSPILYGGTAAITWSASNAGACDLKAYRGLTTAYSIGYKFGVPLARQGASGTITTSAITKENTEYGTYKVSDVLFQVLCFSPDGMNYSYKEIPVKLQEPSAPVTAVTAQPAPTPASVIVEPATATLSVAPAGTVPYNSPVTLSWSSTNAELCTASGDWSAGRPANGSEKTPNLVSAKTYTLVCVNSAGVASAPSTVSVAVAPKPPIPTVSFSAASGNISYDSATTLNWSSIDATACTASEAWSGAKPVSGTFNTGNLKESKTYTITCTGTGGQAGTSVNIAVAAAPAPVATVSVSAPALEPVVVSETVTPAPSTQTAPATTETPLAPPPTPLPPPPPAPVLTFSIEPSTVEYSGSATMRWSTLNATSCRSSGGDWSDATKGTEGSVQLSSLTSNKTYMLTCAGPGGEDTRSATVSVAAPPPPPAPAPASTPVPAPVEEPAPAPSLFTTLINKLTGADEETKSLTVPATPAVQAVVELPPPPTVAIQTIPAQAVVPLSPKLTFELLTSKIEFNKPATLSWRSQQTYSCVARGDWRGERPVEGTFTTEPLTASRNYILICAGPGGSISSFINLNFESSPQPTISFTANPRVITYGKPISLSWSSTNSQSCTASGDWSGTKEISGSFETSPITSARQYIITCSGPGGYIAHSLRIGAPSAAAIKAGTTVTAPSSSAVKVSAPTTQPSKTPAATTAGATPALSFSYSTRTINGVKNVYLTWAGKNVRSCAASGGWFGSRPVSGTENVGKFKAGTAYRLTCTGATTVTRSVKL